MQDLTLEQLEQVRDALAARIAQGLAQADQEVACLPAYLSPPPLGLKGQALVVDAGGTNLRTALVELSGGEARILAGPLTSTLPDGRHQPVTAEEFFECQAAQIRALGVGCDLPLGYCFSYPALVEEDGDARLLHWTKGIQIPGVEGQKVGAALRRALGGRGPVRVLNDTVACLLGGALAQVGHFEQFIGLIVGTGMNIAGFFPGENLSKLAHPWSGRMAVNLEAGNFHPPFLSDWDETLDRETERPGGQRYEKAISGYYLPQLLALICPHSGLEGSETSQVVVEWAERPGEAPESLAARWLLRRSADLVAAGLAGVANHMAPGSLGIQAEGGLFWKAPGYVDRVQQTLGTLLAKSRAFAIGRSEEVNLFGAAAAVLAHT